MPNDGGISEKKVPKYIYDLKTQSYKADIKTKYYGAKIGYGKPKPDSGVGVAAALDSEFDKLFGLSGVSPVLKGEKSVHAPVSPEVVDPDDPFSG